MGHCPQLLGSSSTCKRSLLCPAPISGRGELGDEGTRPPLAGALSSFPPQALFHREEAGLPSRLRIVGPPSYATWLLGVSPTVGLLKLKGEASRLSLS